MRPIEETAEYLRLNGQNGGVALFDDGPHFSELVPFYEYFHGDTGRGAGASHQTGWTGLIGALLQELGADEQACAADPSK